MKNSFSLVSSRGFSLVRPVETRGFSPVSPAERRKCCRVWRIFSFHNLMESAVGDRQGSSATFLQPGRGGRYITVLLHNDEFWHNCTPKRCFPNKCTTKHPFTQRLHENYGNLWKQHYSVLSGKKPTFLTILWRERIYISPPIVYIISSPVIPTGENPGDIYSVYCFAAVLRGVKYNVILSILRVSLILY